MESVCFSVASVSTYKVHGVTTQKNNIGIAAVIISKHVDLSDLAQGLGDKEDFSSNLCVQTGSEAHPDSSPMGTGGPFPGGKARLGRDSDHSPPYSAEVKNE
jgi:hypothetical protein